jgi:lysophospholipase L1-like esterase
VTRIALAAAVGLFVAAILTINAGSGEAQSGLKLRATANQTGRIALRVEALPGLELTLRDELTGAERRLTPERAVTVLRRFAAWSCAASVRSFTAEQTAPDGSVSTASAEVRTPGCRHRLELVPPRSVTAPARAVVRVRDRWRVGDVGVRLCVTPPGAGAECRTARVPADRAEAVVRVPSLRPGGYRLAATNRWQRLRAAFRARPAGGRLRVLATGDSMVQIIDSFLAERLAGARVRSDARISTGLSKPSLLDWPAHARRQAAGIRPDAVVMFIGANDGFAMGDAPCCGAPWVAEYARRARGMMRSYARGGRARVYWLLLPAARSGIFRETFPAVNAGIRRAARRLADDVRLVELDEFFTPGGRYRSSMRVGGEVVRVRQDDGVHLNTTGAALAATLIARAIRQDRMLR